MARTQKAFAPLENKTITWAAASNSQSAQFTTTVSLGGTFSAGSSTYFPNVLKIDNQTDKPVFVASQAGSAPTAATTDFQVNPDSVAYIDVGQKDYVAVIPSASATGSVYLARGLGGI